MKVLWLKIAGIAVLVVVAVAVLLVGVFWSSEPESQEVIASAEAGRIAPTKAERLYQMALREKNAGGSSERKYQIVAGCCRQILELYPDIPQADKARELLQEEAPEKYQKQYHESAACLYRLNILFIPAVFTSPVWTTTR